jgi:RNA polymerase sigma-70 factor (ECF subfamily)
VADSTVSFGIGACATQWEVASGAANLAGADAMLLEGLQRGDERAYEALVERFQHPVYSLVYRLMADPSDAGDVVQEVFLKVFRGVGSFRGQSSLKTWVYRIAVNEANNHRRWFSRRKGHEVGLAEEQGDGLSIEQSLPDESLSPYEIALSHETQALVEAALQQLKPAFRQAVILRDVEGLSYDEIAEILDISLGTVKSRILRGREALRAILSPEPELGIAQAVPGVQGV